MLEGRKEGQPLGWAGGGGGLEEGLQSKQMLKIPHMWDLKHAQTTKRARRNKATAPNEIPTLVWCRENHSVPLLTSAATSPPVAAANWGSSWEESRWSVMLSTRSTDSKTWEMTISSVSYVSSCQLRY